MPTRPIDVGTQDGTTILLINTGDLSRESRKLPYVILRYRWGSANDSARTTIQKMQERLNFIEPNSLPKIIRDAINLTQLMRIRYPWVDAVCIIQSDRNGNDGQHGNDSRIDWERESTYMASYYANSFCCIAASSAKDSSEGILVERRLARYRNWYNPPNVFLQSPYTPGRRIPSLLFDRGWCLQEWIFSPRILYWTAQGLVWECSHGFFWEGQTGFQGERIEKLTTHPTYGWYRKINDCVLKHGLSDEYITSMSDSTL